MSFTKENVKEGIEMQNCSIQETKKEYKFDLKN